MDVTPNPVWLLEAQLGEGPAWFPGEQALRFVDIKRGLLCRYIPAEDKCETLELGGQPSFVVPADGGLVVGSGHRLHHVTDSRLGPVIADLDMPAHNRTNDATVDCFGRLWFGTMDNDETQPTGALWCYDHGALHRLGCEAVVTNGPAVSQDVRTLYLVDSGARAIWRLAIGFTAAGHPLIEQKEKFLQLDEADGYPDGVVLDAEGCLWVALWDGWGVRRYAPDGTLMCHIALPCARVTKIAFGGPDLRTVYVTTARVGLDEAALARQPLAGALFAFDSPVSGLPLPTVQLAN